MKTSSSRIADAIKVIRKVLPNVTDQDNAIALVERRVESFPQKNALGSALSLGGYEGKTPQEEERRQAIRCLVLLQIVCGKQPLALAEGLKDKHAATSLANLLLLISGQLPLFDESPLRATWDPNLMSDPATGAGDRRSTGTQFRYIVFGMMNSFTGRGVSYETILATPGMVQTFLLSTTLIGTGKVSAYYPYGLILRVPADCIVATHHADQAFKNYKANESSLARLDAMDMRNEIRKAAAMYPIRTPDDILTNTKRADGMTGYNEVVVMGTSPANSRVTVTGFFMKVNAKGDRYIRQEMKTAWVTDAIYTKMQGTGLPIIEIVDNSGK